MPLFLLIKGTVWTVLYMGAVSGRVVLHAYVVRYKTALNVGSQTLVHKFLYCHIEAVVRWCQTEERAWEDGDALMRWVMDGLLLCGGFLCICCGHGDGLQASSAGSIRWQRLLQSWKDVTNASDSL